MRGRKKSEDTRLAILRCAAEVFSERPYHEVLTDEISSRLKIGKGTLYRYFAPRKSCTSPPSSTGSRGMQGAIDEALGETAPLEKIIEALARTIIGYFWERRDFFVLLYRHEAKLDAERTGGMAEGPRGGGRAPSAQRTGRRARSRRTSIRASRSRCCSA